MMKVHVIAYYSWEHDSTLVITISANWCKTLNTNRKHLNKVLYGNKWV